MSLPRFYECCEEESNLFRTTLRIRQEKDGPWLRIIMSEMITCRVCGTTWRESNVMKYPAPSPDKSGDNDEEA